MPRRGGAAYRSGARPARSRPYASTGVATAAIASMIFV
jgi:hypothetical protein